MLESSADLTQLLRYLIDEAGRTDIEIPPAPDAGLRLLRALMNIRPPDPLPDGVLELQDRVLQRQRAARPMVDPRTLPPAAAGASFPGAERLVLWQGDITTLAADAIVNAANAQLLGCFVPLHNCIDNAIHSAAGMQLRLECQALMRQQGHPEPTGRAKITRGYNLPAGFVIHTVGPIIESEPTAEDARLLSACYRSCLEAARAGDGIYTLAFCAISTGVFRFPPDRAAEIAVDTVCAWLQENPGGLERVIFDVFSEEDYHRYLTVFRKRAADCGAA